MFSKPELRKQKHSAKKTHTYRRCTRSYSIVGASAAAAVAVVIFEINNMASFKVHIKHCMPGIFYCDCVVLDGGGAMAVLLGFVFFPLITIACMQFLLKVLRENFISIYESSFSRLMPVHFCRLSLMMVVHAVASGRSDETICTERTTELLRNNECFLDLFVSRLNCCLCQCRNTHTHSRWK